MTALASLVLALLLGPGAGSALHASAAGHHPVAARLLADVETVVPGRPLRLGVELRMEEGWHTYWKFSGAAGLPTEVDWRMPPGYEAPPLQWPLPSRYSEEGGLTVYGYAGEVVLIAPVTPPPLLPADSTVSFAAEVSWLVCREVCIPGEATVALDLPVDTGAAAPANQEVFERFAAQVPQPLAPDLGLDYRVSEGAAGMRVDLAVARGAQGLGPEPQVVDFFPFGAAAPAVGPAQLSEEDGRVRLRFALELPDGQDPGSLRGWYSTASRVRRKLASGRSIWTWPRLPCRGARISPPQPAPVFPAPWHSTCFWRRWAGSSSISCPACCR